MIYIYICVCNTINEDNLLVARLMIIMPTKALNYDYTTQQLAFVPEIYYILQGKDIIHRIRKIVRTYDMEIYILYTWY